MTEITLETFTNSYPLIQCLVFYVVIPLDLYESVNQKFQGIFILILLLLLFRSEEDNSKFRQLLDV